MDLPGHRRCRLPRQAEADGTVRGNRDRLRFRRNGDLRLERIAVLGDHVAVTIEVKLAAAREGHFARRPANLEEALALHHHVERIASELETALFKDDRVGGGARAQTNLKARGDYGLRRRRRPRLRERLVEQILKLGATHLEANGIRVRQIVRNVVDVDLLGDHAAASAIECSNHGFLPGSRISVRP